MNIQDSKNFLFNSCFWLKCVNYSIIQFSCRCNLNEIILVYDWPMPCAVAVVQPLCTNQVRLHHNASRGRLTHTGGGGGHHQQQQRPLRHRRRHCLLRFDVACIYNLPSRLHNRTAAGLPGAPTLPLPVNYTTIWYMIILFYGYYILRLLLYNLWNIWYFVGFKERVTSHKPLYFRQPSNFGENFSIDYIFSCGFLLLRTYVYTYIVMQVTQIIFAQN